jgi:putative redox protein
MNYQKVSFENKDGLTLSGRLVLFAHCFTCTKNLNAVRSISNSLVKYGFGVLSFDFTGLGNSTGDFVDTNFSSNIEDLESAAAFLENNYRAPSLIVGHSLGGAASIYAGHRLSSIQAIATIGAPADPDHVQHLFENSMSEIEASGQAKVNIGGRPFHIKKQLIDDLNKYSLAAILKDLRKSILILHSPQDSIVSIENAAKIYSNAHHPKSFITLDGADRLLSNIKDATYAGEVIAAWANRYVQKPRNLHVLSNQGVNVRLAGGSENKYTTHIVAGKHHLVADEPEDVGGSDLGPSPYQLLSSALGACTAMTLKMYVDHKKWELEEVFVHLEHEKKHAQDCNDCENSASKLDEFTRKITIKGDLSEDQKKRLMEIADKCPLHRTLMGKIDIKTELVD